MNQPVEPHRFDFTTLDIHAPEGSRGTGSGASRLVSRKPATNQTGMPDRLKAGVETLSGVSLNDVRVHYNSSKPARLQASAYTQGDEIHIGPGQEKHLAHEAWHVVQQRQGRVRETLRTQGVPINDDRALEREADVMGARVLRGGWSGVAAVGARAAAAVPRAGGIAESSNLQAKRTSTTAGHVSDRHPVHGGRVQGPVPGWRGCGCAACAGLRDVTAQSVQRLDPLTSTSSSRNGRVVQRCKTDPSCPNQSPCPQHENRQYMMQQQQRKRRGGGTRTTLIGATSFKEELRQAGESEQPMLAKYDVSQGNLDAVKSEPWAQKRLAKLRQTLGKGFDVTFQKNARRGETSRQGIEIGHEGLTSKEMARVTLRHELDHAKFYDPNRKLRIGPYRASYVGRGKVGPEKDTFHYRLEEMLVRLRDFEHASTGNKTAFTEGFSEDDARKRISTAYSDLLNAKDIEEIDPTYRKEVLAKLWHMQYALCNPV